MRRATVASFRLALGGVALSIALALASKASANGRPPATSELLVRPGDPSKLLLRATFGLLFSEDEGKTFHWLCEQAVGYGGVEDPSVALAGSDAVMTGMFEGLSVSPDDGCSWSFAGGPLAHQVIIDIDVRADDAHAAAALTSTLTGSNDAGDSLYYSQLFLTADDGRSWAKAGVPIDPTILTETMALAKTDRERVYASGSRGSGDATTATLVVSKDGGGSWTEHSIPIDPKTSGLNESAAYIAAVAPDDAETVYVRTIAATTSRLLVTHDAGASWSQKWSGGLMLGFALSADGSKVYVGSIQDGLHVASTRDFQFSQRSKIHVQCITLSGTLLYACSDEASGFILGSSTDDGKTFASMLELDTVRGPLACPAPKEACELDAATRMAPCCSPLWPSIAQQIGAPVDGGGGPIDAGGPIPPGKSPAGGGCGCGTAVQVNGAAAACAFLALGFLLRARRGGAKARREDRDG